MAHALWTSRSMHRRRVRSLSAGTIRNGLPISSDDRPWNGRDLPPTSTRSDEMARCVRVAMQLDVGLHAKVTRLAGGSGRTMEAVVQDARGESLTRRLRVQLPRTELPVIHGPVVQAGVDIGASAALLEIMGWHDASTCHGRAGRRLGGTGDETCPKADSRQLPNR